MLLCICVCVCRVCVFVCVRGLNGDVRLYLGKSGSVEMEMYREQTAREAFSQDKRIS